MARPLGLAAVMSSFAMAMGAFAAQAAAESVLAVTPGNVLVNFDSATPTSVTTVGAVTGLGANETVRGIDVGPTTGQVFIVTVTIGSAANSVIKTYTVDPNTAAATFFGQTAAALAGAADVPTGWDFSPKSPGGIRYLNTNDENARISATNGGLAGNDTDLTPAATTTLIGAAFDRNIQGAALTTEFGIDRNDSQLAIVGGIDGTPSPNGGVTTDMGPLGFNLNQANDGGFDISPTGTAFAALTDAADNLTRLYTLSLPTGPATAIGLIGNGQTEVRSIAILDDDRDADGLLSSADNCDSIANTGQEDLDNDGVGDACEDDTDGDGVANGADNCPLVATSDQANLDGDTEGDACDADDDNDGLDDVVEGQLGTNPRSTDSDRDGKADGSDACPTLAATGADGCAAVFSFTLGGLPNTITLGRLRRRGVTFSVEPTLASSFVGQLLARPRAVRFSRAGDLVVAEKRLSLAAGRRTMRLRPPRSMRKRLRAGIRLRVNVTARDLLGRTVSRKGRVRVRRG